MTDYYFQYYMYVVGLLYWTSRTSSFAGVYKKVNQKKMLKPAHRTMRSVNRNS